jgi:hypothetical protein
MSNSANLRSSTLRALARLSRVESEEAPDPDPKDSDAEANDTDQMDDSEELGGDVPDMVPDEEDPDLADGEVDDGDEAFTLDDVIKCFLRANPNPTDEQVHAFADLLDMSYEEFEAQIFKKFGEVIRQATSIGPSESENDVEVEGGDSDAEGEDTADDIDETQEDPESDAEIEADDSLDVQDDIDMFVIAYMLFNPEPDDEQIHKLAFVVDLTREQMEERIYRMLANYMQVEDGDGSEDNEGEDGDSGGEENKDATGEDTPEDTTQTDGQGEQA